MRQVLLGAGIGLTVLLIDQLSKAWAGQQGLVSLNQGVAFGLSLPSWVWWIMAAGMTGALFFLWWQQLQGKTPQSQLITTISLGLIMGGGVANALDRWRWGGVQDWLSLPLTGLHNNLADWAIVIGCGLLMIVLLRKNREKKSISLANSGNLRTKQSN